MGKRLTQIGNIRALTIFLVVLGHSIILYSAAWDLYETTVSAPVLALLKRIVDAPQMPLFVSLSGYLFFFTRQKKAGFLSLLKSKSLRLLIPYVGIGCLYMLPIRLAVGLPSYRGISFNEFLMKLLTSNDVGHLWFLPALFLMFVLSEPILSIAEKLPCVKHCPSVLLGVIASVLYLVGYRIGFGYPPLLGAYNYLIWFSLGYFLSENRSLVQKVYSVPPIKWALLAMNLALYVYYCSVDSVRVLVMLGLRVLCIVNAFGAMPQRTCRVAEKVDRNSFGVYLFHSPLIYITFATIPNAPPVIVVFINLVCFGAAAYGLTALIRKTKLKVLIGE